MPEYNFVAVRLRFEGVFWATIASNSVRMLNQTPSGSLSQPCLALYSRISLSCTTSISGIGRAGTDAATSLPGFLLADVEFTSERSGAGLGDEPPSESSCPGAMKQGTRASRLFQ